MNVSDMLKRFRPVYAADGEGDGGAPVIADTGASTADPAQGTGAADGADGADEFDIDIGLDDPEQEPVQEPEWEDFELDDLKLRVPKGLRQKVEEGFLRQGDYTKKTQAVAERERAIEARETQARVVSEYDSKLSEGTFHLRMMDSDLEKEYKFFQSPEWTQLQQDDFIAAQTRWNRFQMSKDQRAQLVGALQALANERNSKVAEAQKAHEAAVSKQREQLPREIAKLVPGWNADTAAKVEDFAVRQLGYEPEALKSTTEPRHFQTLHLAMLGQMYLDAKARKASGGVIPKPSSPTKVTGQRGATASNAPGDRDDINTWMQKERARVAAKAQSMRKARA